MTREEWLNAFKTEATKVFTDRGFEVPSNVRVSIGFPSTGNRGKRIGECWFTQASADQHFEIFMHPGLQSDSARIAGILTHELVHTVFPTDGHGRLFKRCATSVGLTGKMTATTEGPEWHEWADPILADLGPLPGADLRGGENGRKKQTTRLLKMECDDCGLVLRISAKWIENGDVSCCPDRDCGGKLHLEN
jgi:hypothetical protein